MHLLIHTLSRSLLCFVLLSGCAQKTHQKTQECEPEGVAQSQPKTALEYVAMCEPELGVPPEFDCAAGVTLPITVDGVEVTGPVPNYTCDAPSLQEGECFPGSTINRLMGRTREGVERPDVVWVQFCRNEGMVNDQGEVSLFFTGAQLIGYNYESGATCFFELNVGSQEQWVSRDENNRAMGVLPSFDDPSFDQAFVPPGDVQCVQCHQNDPFIHHPWVDSARLPSNPSESVLPSLPADAPYYIVGGASRDMRTIHIEGNACLTCHRMGMETDMLFRANGLHANQFMPPSNPGSMASDYQELLDCWENGPENTPGCEWRLPPGGECAERPAGDAYPNAAEYFNCSREVFFSYETCDDQGEDEWDGEIEDCEPDFDPSQPCTGDWTETLCTQDGLYWWCENGTWYSEKEDEDD